MSALAVKNNILQEPIIKNILLKVYHAFWNTAAHILGDKAYIKLYFKEKVGYPINLDKPETFNEKLNWLKLYDRSPIYSMMADKYEVKRIVRERAGEEFVVPCYGVWSSFDSIDFESLPDTFVLKATGDSSGAILCKDKKTFDYAAAKQRLDSCLKRNYYYRTREWPYKGIQARIIADQLLDDHTGNELRDYKFWCFNGVPRLMYCTVKTKDKSQVYENFYDMDFNVADIDHGFPRHQPEFHKPTGFETMKELATKLSKDIPFVRIDMFEVDGHVYFGEFTFFDWAGLQPFKSYDTDKMLGDWIKLQSL